MLIMRIDIYHHHSWDEAPQEVRELLSLILRNQEKIMTAIDDLQAAVTAEDTVIDSAVALLNGIPALIAAAGVDPAKLTALQADIQTRTAALAAAVIVGTPTAPPSAAPVTPAAASAAAAAATTP
jgi:copper homeostasis protein CutC